MSFIFTKFRPSCRPILRSVFRIFLFLIIAGLGIMIGNSLHKSGNLALRSLDGSPRTYVGELVKKQQNTSEPQAPTKVVLVTYYRGGSTFVGEAFNRNPEAFYWFEPLITGVIERMDHRPIQHSVEYEDAYITGPNNTFSEFSEHYVDEQCQIISQILNCRLAELDKTVLTYFFVSEWFKSATLTPYTNCMRKYAATLNTAHGSHPQYPDHVISECLPLAIEKCEQSRIRSIKTIRFGGYFLQRLLQLDQTIKIVHSVRDPRGMLTSINSFWGREYNVTKTELWARAYCHRMSQDFVLMPEGPSVLRIRYEDMASTFNHTLAQVYAFIGRQLPLKLEEWFRQNTEAARDNGGMGTARVNATETAYKWRSVMPLDNQKVITEACQQTLQMYNYDP